MVLEDLECDICFKKVDSAKDLRKMRNIKMWKCKECQEKYRKSKFSWYEPFEMLKVTLDSGTILIGVKSSQGQFIALNRVLLDYIKPFQKCSDFVAHIKEHLDNDPKLKGEKVVCKFCDKSIDEIWDENEKQKKQKEKKTKG